MVNLGSVVDSALMSYVAACEEGFEAVLRALPIPRPPQPPPPKSGGSLKLQLS